MAGRAGGDRHVLAFWDWVLILTYLLLSFITGLAMKRKADRGLESYFAAGRSAPWWWLGTSMVATTFAADTPLWVAGAIATYGISGNWFWWSHAVGYVFMTVFFARMWRESGVITDVELTELRYGGPQAAILRAVKAFFSSILVNCIVLGWVFAAMAKITRPFVHWDQILGASLFSQLESNWPHTIVFRDFNNTLTILSLVAIVVAYSSAGGIRGVMITDLYQFAIAMFASVAFAVLAVSHVGGLESLWQQLEQLYPATHRSYTSFVPSFTGENALMPLSAFLVSLGFLWWTKDAVDGSGYMAQRMYTARTPEDSEWGSLWFTIAHLVLRSWPWVLVGLVALVVYPVGDDQSAMVLDNDREMAYPVLMQQILGPGWLGFVFLSLLAAFMSTVDTHINWGASYIVNDFYKRFINPTATDRQLVKVSRRSVIGIAMLAVLVATQIDSLDRVWKFYAGMVAGMGLPHLLRWFWWRANAWTEISGMVTGFIAAVVLYNLPATSSLRGEYLIAMIGLISMVASLVATWLTKPVDEEKLVEFVNRVHPVGYWRGWNGSSRPVRSVRRSLYLWALGVFAVYALMFGVGQLLRLSYAGGGILVALGVASLLLTVRGLDASRRE